MYVSIHATRHPVEGAGFLTLERLAFADEGTRVQERLASWLAACPEAQPCAVPQQLTDPGPMLLAV